MEASCLQFVRNRTEQIFKNTGYLQRFFHLLWRSGMNLCALWQRQGRQKSRCGSHGLHASSYKNKIRTESKKAVWILASTLAQEAGPDTAERTINVFFRKSLVSTSWFIGWSCQQPVHEFMQEFTNMLRMGKTRNFQQLKGNFSWVRKYLQICFRKNNVERHWKRF